MLYKVAGREAQARVRIDGKDILLGPYGSEESRIKYGILISQAACALSVDPLASRVTESGDTGLLVTELLLAFKRHADVDCSKDGKKTAEVDCLNSAMRPI